MEEGFNLVCCLFGGQIGSKGNSLMEGGMKLETKYTWLSTTMVPYMEVRKVREKVKVKNGSETFFLLK